jgi:uncharacterized repeat protein (TIGR02543 family)
MLLLFGWYTMAYAYNVSFVNNTNLPNGYTICAQGYAAGGANPAGNFMVLSLDAATNQASFTTTSSLSPVPIVGDALPAFAINPGTTQLNVTTSSGLAPIIGARVYYYVAQGNTCFPYLYYSAVGNAGQVANNFPAGGAYVFSEITSTSDNSSGQTFDLSMVDAFAMPVNATITSTTAGYTKIGQFDATSSSAQNLVNIRTDFSNAMSAIGARGQPYLSLLASSFGSAGPTNALPNADPVTWPSYTYPSGTAPILNPHTLLSQFIPNPPSPAAPVGVFFPGVGSPLNYIFNVDVSNLFSRNSYLNKTGIPLDTFYATPVSNLPLPTGYSNSQLVLLQANYTNGLPGLALCYVQGPYMTPNNICGSQSSGLNATGWIYNPLNSTIMTTLPNGSLPITGSVSASSSTITFDSPVTLPADVSLYGWYLKINNSTLADGFHYVTGCNGTSTVAACSGTLQSVMVNEISAGSVSGSQVVFGLFPSTSKNGAGQDGSFASSGDQVFGNLGVFGGILSGSDNQLSANTAGSDIGNILVTAINRGVSSMSQTYSSNNDPQSTDSWLWAQETNWYPTSSATRNEYAFYLHTRTLPNANADSPLFSRPSPPASSADPGGLPMGMAYGFAFDENPAPSYADAPQVPSEWNQTVGGDIVVSFGPWLSATPSQFQLTVSKSGTGASGSGVTAALQSGTGTANFICPDTCTGTYDPGATVLLTAKSSATATFAGWSLSTCPGSQLTCLVTMSQSQTVTATFNTSSTGKLPLAVTVSGPGYVTSLPTGISCGATLAPQDCVGEFAAGTPVTLNATPTGAGVFVGWSGCSSSTATCTISMSQAQSVRATFASPVDYTLTITSNGGAVTGTSGVSICNDAICTDALAPSTSVTLYAASGAGYTFSGWGGACASFGTAPCSLSMTANQAVIANFVATPVGNEPLIVHVDGPGLVTGTGINCPTSCSQDYPYSTVVSLVAIAPSGYQFTGWYGACSGTAVGCFITMDQSQSVTAKFTRVSPPPPNPIPTLSEWARLLLVFSMMGAFGWYGRRMMKH